jgi:phenylacetate-CoA ligase
MTGPTVSHSIRTDAGALLDWLQAEAPGYLFTYPSLVVELARLSLDRGVRLPGLLEVRTLAESLGSDVRALCREAWGVPLTDLYSASECGYMALQCPEHEHYHVQSEGAARSARRSRNTLLARRGRRIVVTSLHNFAMPLVRYDIGDYAEVGEPCACGRGLPVLRRILGRVRNTLVTADGKRYWPAFGTRALMDAAPIRQHQFVQKSVELIEARLVVNVPLTPAQEALVRERVMSQLPAGMTVQIVYCDRLERTAGGKFEDFVSEIAPGGCRRSLLGDRVSRSSPYPQSSIEFATPMEPIAPHVEIEGERCRARLSSRTRNSATDSQTAHCACGCAGSPVRPSASGPLPGG